MEDLSKTQFILLVLLVTFVTSVAASIVTVSLLSGAPPTVTQTVNRVVEKTIERVIPGKTVIREVEKVPTESELVEKVIMKNQQSLFRVVANAEQKRDLGTAVVFSKDGILVARGDLFAKQDSSVEVVALDGTSRPFEILGINTAKNFAIVRIKDRKEKESFHSVKLIDSIPSLGKSIVALTANAEVSLGYVNAITGQATSTTDRTTFSVAFANEPPEWTPLFSLQNDLVGILVGKGQTLRSGEITQAIQNLAQ